MRIFINNLPLDITDEDLETMFSAYGKVLSAKVVTDADSGESRGFGFVEMSTVQEGKTAIEELNGQNLREYILVVETARPEEKPIY